MAAARRPTPVAMLPLDERTVGLLQSISDQVGELAAGHAEMKLTLGKVSENGRDGTGLVGQVLALSTEVKQLQGLKILSRGFILGAGLVGAVVVLGLKGATSALATLLGAMP